MINENQGYTNRVVMLLTSMTLLLLSSTVNAAQFNLNVVDHAGNAVTGFRWIIEKDTTFAVDPANPSTDPDSLLSLGFHSSHHPVATGETDASSLNGQTDGSAVTITNIAPGRYYVSVLPFADHSISGGPVTVLADADDPGNVADDLTVTVEAHPIPTAQISIYLFHDNSPINGAPDLPEETNPAQGEPGHVDWTQFNLFLEEPGGRYGMAGGQVIQDAFGNPLGTVYREDCAIDHQPDTDPLTNFICYVDGAPIVESLGNGTLQPNSEGLLMVKNLAPGKYGIIINPPTKAGNESTGWVQTSTIEGTRVIDAWVKANEPAAFVEFGPPGPHVFVGFIKSTEDGGFPPLQGNATITGTVTDIHMSRPPYSQFYSGRDFPGCWIGLNDMAGGGIGTGVYATPCDGSSGFSIPNVPPGSYNIVVFDTNLDVVISAQPVTVDAGGATCNGGGSCALGDIGVFNWFARLNTSVFNDINQNGFQDIGEEGIGPESQSVTLRWRDGTMYQSFPTDGDGNAPFDEKFPFFNWLVAEVSFTNKKATGATFVVDAGGPVDKANTGFPGFGELTPVAHCSDKSQYDPATNSCPGYEVNNPNTGDNFSRTVVGPVLTQGVQAFLGQTNVLQFGKTDYISFTPAVLPTVGNPQFVPPKFVGENGGISGIVYYATTRAEDNPEEAAAEVWEPGVPRVQFALYADGDIDSFPTGASFPNGIDALGSTTYGDIDWNGDGIADADDGMIDDIDQNGCIGYADVNNYPFDDFPGPGDIDYGWVSEPGSTDPNHLCAESAANRNGQFDLHDALQVAYSDSWDDNLPTGCQGRNNVPGSVVAPAVSDDRCFDGLRNYNQVADGVFDGGYAFSEYDLAHITAVNPGAAAAINSYLTQAENAVRTYGDPDPVVAANLADNLQLGLLPNDYIVQMNTPPGMKNLSEHHKNVDFGDEYIPQEGQGIEPTLQALPPVCVGESHVVPQYLAMVTKDGSGDAGAGGANLVDIALLGDETVYAPFAGDTRPSCDMKEVPLSSAQNAAAEFFVMTDVPKAANVTGMILNDLANEFNPNSPNFGEKYAPPHTPVAFYDWNGNQVNRVYADEHGTYNAIVPSTFTANLPMPSGMSPNMLISCMNDAGPIVNPAYDASTDNGSGIDGNGQPKLIVDPFFDPRYSQFCYTFQYMPGTITYLDTPVVQVAAFAGVGQNPLDCEQPGDTPMISSVTRVDNTGPFVLPGEQIRIDSMGQVSVPNPEWDGVDQALKNIVRDYRFDASRRTGTQAWLEDTLGNRIQLTRQGASNRDMMFAQVPNTVAPGEYQLTVVNTNGVESPYGVTLTVGVSEGMGRRSNGDTYNVWHVPGDFATIQEAIGNPLEGQTGVASGDLILVAPGIYDELVIMWKPVKLQGWGAGAVTINARQSPTEKIIHWRELADYLANTVIDQLPGQTLAPFGFPGLNAGPFPTEEGAGVFVAGPRRGPNRFGHPANRGARIDGFTIIGASTGGGIVANGYNQFLAVSNNRLEANAGFNGGGIRIGHPELSHTIANESDPAFVDGDPNRAVGSLVYDDAVNDQVRIHHNYVVFNGTLNGPGGGIGLHTGSDNYKVTDNFVCGNFSQGGGGGIAHLGRSRNGLIEDNRIVFNETFAQTPGTAPPGGGIMISGQPALIPEVETGLLLSPGTGNVTIDANLIRGNLAGAGDGGGISLNSINGQDIAQSLGARGPWYRVLVYNNMIDNNVAGLAAGGISLSDAPKVYIRNNTVANNDSTATGSQAFAPNSPNMSTAMPAGIVSRSHSGVMAQLLNVDEGAGQVFVDPSVFGNRPEGARFSDPVLRDTIAYHNRSFYWTNFDDPTTLAFEFSLVPVTCDTPTAPVGNPNCDITSFTSMDGVSWDLGVLDGIVEQSGNGDRLNPRQSLLTDSTPYHRSNITGDPGFVNGYFNVGRDSVMLFIEPVSLSTAAALDEGGNFIQVAFGPLSLIQPVCAGAYDPVTNFCRTQAGGNADVLFDYHLGTGSAAIDQGGNTPANGPLSVDIDNQPRPTTSVSDIGADEVP
ncbi:MAG: choice-of-anchor Q domain-containing protein [Candidatus Thiodiazotropha sp.]